MINRTQQLGPQGAAQWEAIRQLATKLYVYAAVLVVSEDWALVKDAAGAAFACIGWLEATDPLASLTVDRATAQHLAGQHLPTRMARVLGAYSPLASLTDSRRDVEQAWATVQAALSGVELGAPDPTSSPGTLN